MEPEDDFENWSLILTNCLEQGGEYSFLVDGYCRLIQQILEHSKLSGSLEVYTDYFLSETVPIVTNRLLNFPFVSQQEQVVIDKYLISSAILAAWAFSKDNFELFTKIDGPFDSNQSYYAKNWASTFSSYDSIVKGFIQKGGVTIMTDRILSGNDLTIDHFFYYYSVMSSKAQFQQCDDQICLSTLIIFMEFVKTVGINSTKVQQTCLSAIVIASSAQGTKGFFDDMLEFAEKLVESEKVNIQMTGATILNTICIGKRDHVAQSYDEWKAKTKLCDYLVTHNLNSKLISVLEPVYVSIMTRENLNKLWSMATVAHSSERSTMMSIVAKALKSLELSDAKLFIDERVKNDQSSEIITFLVETLESSYTENSQFALYCLEKLIQIPGSGNKIKDVIDYKMDDAFRKQLCAFCIDHLTKEEENCLVILQKIATLSYYSNIFPETFLEFLFGIAKEGKISKETTFSLFSIWIEKEKQKIDVPNLNMLLSVDESDVLWQFFVNLFEKQGIQSFTESAFKELAKVLEKQDKVNMSNVLAQLFTQFVKNYAFLHQKIQSEYLYSQQIKQNSLKLVPKSFIVASFPLDYMELVSDALLTTQNVTAAEYIKSFFLEIYARTKKPEQVTDHILSMFERSETNLSKQRSLSLLKDYVAFFDGKCYPEDFGIKSHKNRIIDFDSLDLFIEYKDKRITLTVPARIKIETLKTRIGLIFGIDEKSFRLFSKTNNSEIYQYYQSENKLKYGEEIQVMENQGMQVIKSSKKVPIVSLSEKNFQEKLIPLLEIDEPELQNTAVKLLNILPNCQSLLEMANKETEKFCEKMKSANLYMFRYMTELVTPKLVHKTDSAFTHTFISSLKELLFSKLSDLFIRLCLLKIIVNNYTDDFNVFIPPAVPILLQTFQVKTVNSNLMKYAISLLTLFQQHDPRTSQFCFENRELFIESIRRPAGANWEKYKKCLELFPKKPLFDICLSIMDNFNKNDEHFMDLFSMLVQSMGAEIDLQELLQKCINLLKDAKGLNLIGLCSSITSMLNAQQSEISKYKYLTDDLLRIVLRTMDAKEQDSLFRLCLTLGIDNWSLIERTIENTCTEHWNIDPLLRVKSSTGFSGLRNLGATCYMNSIIQQLYHIPVFLQNVIGTKLEKEGHSELQQLLTAMTFTLKKGCDTQAFVSKWLGWGKRTVNPKEQQDAFEFLQLLLDQLPENCNKFFKGSIRNIMKGATENFESFNIESFYTIPLEVKGCKNVDESFNVFLQSEQFQDYRTEGIDHPFDIVKEARIESAPNILVLQLKRFEYDIRTFDKVKINERFEFPDEIDITPLLYEKKEEKCMYRLRGVVLHSGTAQGGHYNSLIKKGSEWLLFNDNDVTVFPQSKFEQEAFGGQNSAANAQYSFYADEYDTGPSAYLLFYAKEDFDAECDDIPYSKDIVAVVERENDEFCQEQSIFSSVFFKYATEHIENPIPYFINIFSHSALYGNIPQMFMALHKFFSDSCTAHYDMSCQYFVDHFDRIADIYTNCSEQRIMSAVDKCVTTVVYHANPEKSEVIIEKFFGLLPDLLQTVRKQIAFVCNVIFYFSYARKERALELNIAKKIVDFMNIVYGTQQRSSLFLQSVDISSLFRALITLNSFDYDVQCFQTFAHQIIQCQENNQFFLELYLKLAHLKKLDLTYVLNMLLSSKQDTDKELCVETMLDYALENGFEHAEEMVGMSIVKKVDNFFFCQLLQRVAHRDENAIKFVLEKTSIIMENLCSQSNETSSMCEHTIYYLCPTIKQLFSQPLTQASSITFASEEEEYDSDTQFTVPEEEKTEFAVKPEDIKVLQKILAAVHETVQKIIENPTLFYPKNQASKQKQNKYFAENKPVLQSFIRVFHWILHVLRFLSDQTEFDRATDLLRAIKAQKKNSDVKQCIELLLSFDKTYTNNYFAYLFSVALKSQKPCFGLLEEFVKYFPMLVEATDEQKILFFQSDIAQDVFHSFPQTEDQRRKILDACKLCLSLRSERAMPFIYAMFKPEMNKHFMSYYQIIISVLTMCADSLPDEYYVTFCEQFLSNFAQKCVLAYQNQSLMNYLPCADACYIMSNDMRWIGCVNISKIELFPNIVCYAKETNACLPIAYFVSKCLPMVDAKEIYTLCVHLFPNANHSEQKSGLFLIMLEVFLTMDKWKDQSAAVVAQKTVNKSIIDDDDEYDENIATKITEAPIRFSNETDGNVQEFPSHYSMKHSNHIDYGLQMPHSENIEFPTEETLLEFFDEISYPTLLVRYITEKIGKSSPKWHKLISMRLLKKQPNPDLKGFISRSIITNNNEEELMSSLQFQYADSYYEWLEFLKKYAKTNASKEKRVDNEGLTGEEIQIKSFSASSEDESPIL